MATLIASGSATSVSANAVSSDQISGTYQFVGPGVFTLLAKSSATGMYTTFTVGGTVLANDLAIPFTGTAGTISTADNVIVSQRILGINNRVELKFRNSTGGALTVDYMVLWDPLLGGVFRRR